MKSNILKIFIYFLAGMALGLLLIFCVARVVWHGKFFPTVSIAQIEVGGLSREEARSLIEKRIANHVTNMPNNLFRYDIESSLNNGYSVGRRLGSWQNHFPLIISQFDTAVYDSWISEVSPSIEVAPREASVAINGKKIIVTNGSAGIMIDKATLEKLSYQNAIWLTNQEVDIPTINIDKRLSDTQLQELKSRAEKLLGKTLTLKLDDEQIVLTTKDLITFLNTNQEPSIVDIQKITKYVESLLQTLNKPPQDARFEFVENKVKEFKPGKDGVEVNKKMTSDKLEMTLNKLVESENKNETMEIVVDRTPPKITTDKVNELGIRERIGRGESYYQHSIPNRIYNVALASSRINSALIEPGEEVSFNKLVGEVSADTGYRPAYIISQGRTILGDGGGLCQVSTTMFRAAMSAGLPILERWGHSYRVSYYELNSKPGVDATVIAPSKDFRFKNDTPGHILIQTINDPKKLYLVIEIYGTSDGRVASINEPKVWGITPPLPTIYQDDPTLPNGTVKQVDWAASGAKASFEYKVMRNGENIQEKTFTTNYQPWASVYLKGTGQ